MHIFIYLLVKSNVQKYACIYELENGKIHVHVYVYLLGLIVIKPVLKN